MPEAEGPQPSQAEQGSTPAQNPETAKPVFEVEGKIVEQKQLMRENLHNIAGNMREFSDINPGTPVSEENKQKLSRVDGMLQVIHRMALQSGVAAAGGSVLMEIFNQAFMGEARLTPGTFTAVMLGPVAATMAVAETGGWTIKGIEKMYEGAKRLTGLLSKNQASGAEGQQPSQT